MKGIGICGLISCTEVVLIKVVLKVKGLSLCVCAFGVCTHNSACRSAECLIHILRTLYISCLLINASVYVKTDRKYYFIPFLFTSFTYLKKQLKYMPFLEKLISVCFES